MSIHIHVMLNWQYFTAPCVDTDRPDPYPISLPGVGNNLSTYPQSGNEISVDNSPHVEENVSAEVETTPKLPRKASRRKTLLPTKRRRESNTWGDGGATSSVPSLIDPPTPPERATDTGRLQGMEGKNESGHVLNDNLYQPDKWFTTVSSDEELLEAVIMQEDLLM